MTLTVRRLNDADAEVARRLGFEAFGVPTEPPSEPATVQQPGRTWFGAFDGDVLAGRMVDREYDSYFGGATLSTSGIAGVTVAAEYRGRGALTPLFTETLSAARSRGAVISTLFPTAPRIYRRFGYEVIGDFCTVEVPSQALAAVTPAEGLSTRRGTGADVEAIRRIYHAWAGEQNGPLTRRGASFPETAVDYVSGFTGITVAVDSADLALGFVSWQRGQGYGDDAKLEITDLLATTPEAYRALIAAMGSFSSVTPQTTIDTSGFDIVRLFLPSLSWRVVDSSPYMLKVLDVSGALTQRRYPAGFSGELSFSVTGDFLPHNNGSYLLDVGSGRGNCVRGEHVGRLLTPHGLALMFAGAQSSANLRAAGHLSGGAVDEDDTWDALFGGRQVHIRNYF